MNEDPYKTPEAELRQATRLNPRRWRAVAAIGVVLASLHLGSFEVMSSIMKNGIENSRGMLSRDQMATEIRVRLQRANLIALALRGGSAVGLVFCGISLFGPGNRERWFFWSTLALASISLFVFPFGTLIGAVLLAGLHFRRAEFQPLITDH